MFLNENGDIAPKIDEEEKEEKKKEPEEPKMTKEEMANWWRDYYEWVKTVYPVEGFEIPGKNGEKLYFHRGNPWRDEDDKDNLWYFLRHENFRECEAERVARNLRGETAENQEAEDKIYHDVRATIGIKKKEKKFSFLVDWNYQGKGYGRAIYDNYSGILDILGIEDREQYQLQVGNLSDHRFLKNMHTKELVARTNSEASLENARDILKDFAQYPNTVKLSDVNAIVEYAKKSNVSNEEISDALNENEFNIFRDTVKDEELERFKSFEIKGLKATRMHKHFMESKGFQFMQLITDADKEDTTLEFKRIFEEIKKQREECEKNNKYIPENLKKFGELEHIILDWDNSGVFFKHVTPEIQTLVKRQAINKFDEFDPEHRSSSLEYDKNTYKTFKVLKDAGLMDKDTYIALYQRAINRNYDLQEFDNAISWAYIDNESRKDVKAAKEEIAQNEYYPYPKGNWQRSLRPWGEGHRISKVEIPHKLSKQKNLRELIKKEIVSQGTARKRKIKTTMMGVGKDEKPFVVDNLKDWLFGVPGAHGNLQMQGTAAVTLPPQTPKFAVELIKQTLDELAYPGRAGRGE